MRTLLIGTLLLSATLGIWACGPVQFSQVKSLCSVDRPCLTANGLNKVIQDFTFTTSNRVDILIVDDNSGSMGTEQQNMATYWSNVTNLLNQRGLDWQVGITDTDVCPSGAPANMCASGHLGARGAFLGPSGSNPEFGLASYIIQKSDSNAQQKFSQTIQRTETGSGDERGIYALNLAVDRRAGANSGFFRDNSALAVIVLSDEDERSVGADPSKSSNPAYAALETQDLPQTFISNVNSAFGGNKNLRVNSIIIKEGDSSCLQQQAQQPPSFTANYGTVYARLSNMTGGKIGSICDSFHGAFSNMMNEIAGSIIEQPNTKTITLGHVPAHEPEVIFIPAGNAVIWDWIDGTNRIELSQRPVDGTTVQVDYDYQ